MIATYSEVYDQREVVAKAIEDRVCNEVELSRTKAKIKELMDLEAKLTQDVWDSQAAEKREIEYLAVLEMSKLTRTEVPGTEAPKENSEEETVS